jgi:oxygen-dependent protoporphyrinogen oxidase
MDLVIPPRREESDETVGSFVRRRLGQEAMDKIAEPLMSGIHISDPNYQSLMASFPLFREMERKYGSLIRAMLARKAKSHKSGGNGAGGLLHPSPVVDTLMTGGLRAVTGMMGVPLPETIASANGKPKAKGLYHEGPLPMFMTLRGGLGQLTSNVAQALDGGTVVTGAQVVSLEQRTDLDDESEEPRYRVRTAQGDTFEGHAVVLATPAYVAADLIEGMDSFLSGALQSIRYVTTATVSMGFRLQDYGQQFDGFGFVIPRKENRQITGCTWSSTKFNYRAPNDGLLLRCFIGGPGHEHLAEQPDDDLLAMVRDELRSIMGLTAEPILTRIFRWPKANPQYDVGHIERVNDIHAACAAHPGLFLTGSAYEGVGVPDCVHQGQKAAQKALSYLVQARMVGA